MPHAHSAPRQPPSRLCPSTHSRPSPAATLALLLFATLGEARAEPTRGRRPRTVDDPDFASAPSHRHASLSAEACRVELQRLGVRFVDASPARGVLAPIRLRGPLDGVRWRTELPEDLRATSPYEVLDCRLALALFGLGPSLRARGVVEVVVHSFWRPPPPSWPGDRPDVRHPGGLAVDVRSFVRRSDAAEGAPPLRDLIVARDWRPAIGRPPCTAEAVAEPPTNEAHELRGLFCELARARRFTSMLSPNYDRAHRDHLHLELRPGVRWRIVL